MYVRGGIICNDLAVYFRELLCLSVMSVGHVGEGHRVIDEESGTFCVPVGWFIDAAMNRIVVRVLTFLAYFLFSFVRKELRSGKWILRTLLLVHVIGGWRSIVLRACHSMM